MTGKPASARVLKMNSTRLDRCTESMLWTQATRVRAADLVTSFADLPLAGVLYTDVARDGTRTGANVDATADLAARTSVPVIASGGVGSVADLRALSERGIAACIVGRALYDGTFTLDEALEAVRA